MSAARRTDAAHQPAPLQQFVDDVADFMARRGFPRMAGRVFAWLLVAEPPEQTAAQLSRALGISAGSVSSTTRLLLSVNLVRRLRRPGERADLFWIPPEAMEVVLTAQMDAARSARELFDRGLAAIADRPPSARSRMLEMREMWAFWERELPQLRDRWMKSRKEKRGA